MKKAILTFVLIGLFQASISIAASGAPIPIKTGDKIAFLGDSITQFGFNSPAGYVNLVGNGFESVGIKIVTIPAGISGHKSNDMLARIEKDVISKKPDWVTISCGVNDVMHGARGIELEPYKSNMAAMVDQCQAAGIKVMLLTPTMIGEDQANPNNQKLVAYIDFIRALAKEKNCLLADLSARMIEQVKLPDAGSSVQGKKLTVDGVHMNFWGNEMMAAGVLSAFGLTESQLKAAKEKWADVPAAFEFGVISVTFTQYRALQTAAVKRNQPLNAMVSSAVAKAVNDLIKK